MVHFPEESHGAVCRRLATVVSVPPAPLAKRYKLDDRIDSEISVGELLDRLGYYRN